jgi:hypothetical protein
MTKRACRVCGCTWDRACLTPSGPCWWVAADLCSGCSRLGPGERVVQRLRGRRRRDLVHALLCLALLIGGLGAAIWASGVLQP